MSPIEPTYEFRTGIGTDLHRLVPDRPLYLGGVHVPFPLGLLGHSDGDAVLHATIDAVLGAACMGDIGTLFPDKDPKYKGIESRDLVLIVREKAAADDWEIVNIDTVIQAQQPRLEPFKGQIRRSIAGLWDIDFMRVNVKAKTAEGLGEIGEGQAIAALATVLLQRRVKRRLR